MRGSGTQADPYIITNVAELRQCCQYDHCYMKLGNDIDFNYDTILWGWEPLGGRFNELDGDGYKITNCYCYHAAFINLSSASFTPIVRNVIIEAIFINNAPSSQNDGNGFISWYNAGSGTPIYFYDCDIRVKYYVETNNTVLFMSYWSYSNAMGFYRRCIFNIDFYPNGYEKTQIFNGSGSHNAGDIKNCEIKISIHMANNLFSGRSIYYTDTSGLAKENCLMYVFSQAANANNKIPYENDAVFINIDGMNPSLSDKLCIILSDASGQRFSNSYFILNDVKGNYLDTKDIIFESCTSGNFATSCFMNDKAQFYNKNQAQTDLSGNLHRLTDEQCKSLQDLLDIGFIIV